MDMSESCDLQLWLHRPNQWHDVAEGYVYGFYSNPPVTVDECLLCDWVGKAFADVQSILLDLEFVRGLWVSMNYFNTLGGWELVPPLVQSSRPIVQEYQYRFITWKDTAMWTIKVGVDAGLTLVEWGHSANEDLS